MRASRGRTGAVVVTVLLLGVAAACTDDSGTSPTTTAAPPTTPAPTETTGAPVTTASAEPGFVFGFLRPSAGLAAELATAQETALNFAVEDINAAGGVNGQPVASVIVDEPANGDIAAGIADLVGQGANVILGPVTSTSAKAMLESVASSGVIACSASATAQDLTTLDTAGVFFRTPLPDAASVWFASEQIATRASQTGDEPYKVAILARGDDYGISVGDGLAASLTARGMETVVRTYNPLQVIFDNDAEAIAAEDPDLVVIVTLEESVPAVRSLVRAGVAPTSIIGMDGAFNPQLADGAFPDDPSTVDGLQVIGSTGNRAFIDRMAAVPNQRQIIYGAQMYDCAVAVALAADSAQSPDAPALAPFLSQVTQDGRACSTYQDCLTQLAAGEDIDYFGVSGAIRFDANGDATESRYTLAQFGGGTLSEVTSQDLDLKDVKQQEALEAAILTARLQQVLKALGFYSGPIDGVYGEATTEAVKALQESLGVPVTGIYDEATDAALREKYGIITTGISDATKSIQVLLQQLGFYDGPIDGIYGQETIDAVKALQESLGVPQTGILDGPTLAAAYALGQGNPPPTTTTTAATTTTTKATTTTAAPGTTVPGTTTPPNSTAAPTTAAPTTTTSTTTTTTVPPPDPDLPTILQYLAADPDYSTFVDLLVRAGIVDDSNFLGPYTVFAPNNAAMAKLAPEELALLRADPGARQAFLAYTIVPDKAYTVRELARVTSVPTLYGEDLTITASGNTVTVNDSRVTATETVCFNGNVIPIDPPLIPPTA